MLFDLGILVQTNGVASLSKRDSKFQSFVIDSLTKYTNGDWGKLCDSDKKLNDKAIKNNDDRILAKYDYNGEISIYIITEYDRSSTTILFPEEY